MTASKWHAMLVGNAVRTVPISVGLLLSFLVVPSLLAATPISSFGVSATVQASCSVSAGMSYGAYAAAVKNAKSIISVNCTNSAQYSVYVSADVTQGEGITSQALHNPSFVVDGIYSGSRHDVDAARIPGNHPDVPSGSSFSQPILTDDHTWLATSGKTRGNADAIFVTVIY